MIIFFITVLFFGAAAATDGWIPVELSKKIDYDLETSPLQIKTDSAAGSDDLLRAFFYAQGQKAGRVTLDFKSTIQYEIYDCTDKSDIPVTLPSNVNKIWKITKTAEPRLTIHCNEVEVVNILMSSSTCSDNDWSTTWNKDVTQIMFFYTDTASDSYFGPSAAQCTGLKASWNNIVTDSKFSVAAGTAVTLSCNEGYQLTGDKTVTCTINTEFTYSVEPQCEPCSAGTYRSADKTTCEVCVGSTISSQTGATSCTSCDPGKQANSAKTQCLACPVKTYRSADMAACGPCGNGQQPNGDKTACGNTELTNCDQLPNAELSPSGPAKVKTVVTVTCLLKPPHYVLIGDKQVTCQSNGKWSPETRCLKCGKALSPVKIDFHDPVCDMVYIIVISRYIET